MENKEEQIDTSNKRYTLSAGQGLPKIEITADELETAKSDGDPWEFLGCFTDVYVSLSDTAENDEAIRSSFNASPLRHSLLAYDYLCGQVHNGGFTQLIFNGYGSFIFETTFAETIKSMGAAKISEIVIQAQVFYVKNKEKLEAIASKFQTEASLQNCTHYLWAEMREICEADNNFMQLDNKFYKVNDKETEKIKKYVAKNIDKFAIIKQNTDQNLTITKSKMNGYILGTKTNTTGWVVYDNDNSVDYREFSDGKSFSDTKLPIYFHVQKASYLNKVKKALILYSSGPDLVCTKLKNVLEEHTKGIQFFEVDLRCGEEKIEGFYAMNIVNKIDCADIENSEYDYEDYGPGISPYDFFYMKLKEDIFKDDMDYDIVRCNEFDVLVIVSERLKNILFDAKLKGLQFRDCYDLTHKFRTVYETI